MQLKWDDIFEEITDIDPFGSKALDKGWALGWGSNKSVNRESKVDQMVKLWWWNGEVVVSRQSNDNGD